MVRKMGVCVWFLIAHNNCNAQCAVNRSSLKRRITNDKKFKICKMSLLE